ncbi:MAG: rhomboid family intramembrane serine protease [Bacteroidota bacterium]|nr:rhomboid family intramembrane serine protease [Bacteroidota bacterium]
MEELLAITPIITYIIIGLTCVISFLTMQNNEIKGRYMFNAYAIAHHREWWRFFTHGVLHADFMHLFVNMLSFYFLGPWVERLFIHYFGKTMGEVNYLLLYIGALLFSSLFTFFKQKDNRYYNALGASGAVSAVVFAYILMNPVQPLNLFLAIPIPGWIYGILYLVYSSYMSKKELDNIGHDAHFWGAAYGFVLTILMKPVFFSEFIFAIKEKLSILVI